MRRAVVVALLFLGGLPAANALEWVSRSRHANTTPFQTSIDFVFEFKNVSTRPVAIQNILTNCECLEANTDQKIYQPGQSGRLVARFTVGDRLGVYQRSITVETDESTAPLSQLRVSIEVPESVALSQRTLNWRKGGAATEQTILLRPVPGLFVDFHTAQATNGDFIVHLKTIKTGEVYRLSVKPKSTKKEANAAIRVSGRNNAGHEVLVSAYANVK